MATFKPQNFDLTGINPVGSAADRLFLFWHAYNEEEGLLKNWHESTSHSPTQNQLLDFFLDTWGVGDWDVVHSDPPPRFPSLAYFQALGVVSHQLREEIKKNVLNKVFVRSGDGFVFPPQLQPGVTRAQADQLAQAEIDKIISAFEGCEIKSLKFIDRNADDQANTNCGGQNIYLHALVRMMDIETHCFEIQKQFLQTGRP
jgi:hypothetical protein